MKQLKVSIGLGKGRDIHVYIDERGVWTIKIGPKIQTFQTKAETISAYEKALATAPERKFPAKLPYFTFTRAGGDGSQEPDFDAIEAHGPKPRIIDIVLYGKKEEDMFRAAQEMWSKSALLCSGDGINASRAVALAKTAEEKALCKPGERTFRILNGCRTQGCKFAVGEPPECKPHMTMYFQLVRFPLIGGSASYDSTSHRTIKAIGLPMEEIWESYGADIDGLPAQLSCIQYTAKTGKAWYVSMRVTGQPVGDVEAAPVIVETPEEERAKAFTAEFKPEEPKAYPEAVVKVAKAAGLNRAAFEIFLAEHPNKTESELIALLQESAQ